MSTVRRGKMASTISSGIFCWSKTLRDQEHVKLFWSLFIKIIKYRNCDGSFGSWSLSAYLVILISRFLQISLFSRSYITHSRVRGSRKTKQNKTKINKQRKKKLRTLRTRCSKPMMNHFFSYLINTQDCKLGEINLKHTSTRLSFSVPVMHLRIESHQKSAIYRACDFLVAKSHVRSMEL